MVALQVRARPITKAISGYPTVAVLIEKLDPLLKVCARDRAAVHRRDEVEDLAAALRNTARLLWGEGVSEPVRLGQVTHVRQVQTLCVVVDRLLHPDKSKPPRTGSEEYNDVARRRLARWFWATTFAGYNADDEELYEEALALLAWAKRDGPEPPAVAAAEVPDTAWLAAVRFNPRAWKHRAIVVLLAQQHPRDLLTGERIEVERHFGAAIHGHHLFPRAWARDNPNKAAYEQVDSISNVAAITGYTNTWIRDAAPEHYLGRIRDLGVPADRLRELLSDHLVNYDLLHSDRFAEFRVDRLQRLQHLVATTLKPTHVAGDAALNDSAG